MATAKKETIRTETVTYHLELSQDEAETLRFICERIGGSAYNTPRGHTDAINNALLKCGAGPGNHIIDPQFPSLYFMEKNEV